MQKETFPLKGSFGIEPPFSVLREIKESQLRMDILLLIGVTMILSTSLMSLCVCWVTFDGRGDEIAVAQSHLLTQSCVIIFIAVIFAFIAIAFQMMSLNQNKTRIVLTATLIMSVLTCVMSVGAATLATTYRLEIPLDGEDPRNLSLDDSFFKEKLKSNMETSIKAYAKDYKSRTALDSLQTRYNCCGIEGYTDWIKLQGKIPKSCCYLCLDHEASRNTTYPRGCMESVAMSLAAGASAVAGFGYILSVVLLFSVLSIIYVTCETRRHSNMITKAEDELVTSGDYLTLEDKMKKDEQVTLRKIAESLERMDDSSSDESTEQESSKKKVTFKPSISEV